MSFKKWLNFRHFRAKHSWPWTKVIKIRTTHIKLKTHWNQNDLSIFFYFRYQLKHIKFTESVLSSPPPQKTCPFWGRLWKLKDDRSSGLYDILLLEFMIHGLRTDKKNMFSPSGAKIFHPKGFKGKKSSPTRLCRGFCNWTPSELEVILNRCLFHYLQVKVLFFLSLDLDNLVTTIIYW